MATLHYLISLFIGQNTPAHKTKIKTTEYRSILVSANGKFVGVIEVF